MKQKQFKHNLEKIKRIKNFNAKTNNQNTLHEMFEQMFDSYKDIYKDNILTDLNKLKQTN
jgi:predicted DsbA family dithiol-disulfide isomerase